MSSETEQQYVPPQALVRPPPAPATVHAAGPRSLDNYCGQRRAVELVAVALRAFRRQKQTAGGGASFPHIGCFGPPGTGKTQLIKCLAAELGVPLIEGLGSGLGAPEAANRLLMDARPGSVVFLDEADELPTEVQTALLRAVEEGVLLLPRAGGQFVKVPLVPFTLALASNRPQLLLTALRDRLGLRLDFELYDVISLKELTAARARSMAWPIEPEVAECIAGCARGTPRHAINLLAACWRVACAEASADEIISITKRHFHRACQLEGIDSALGLTLMEQNYIRFLAGHQGAVRPSVIAAYLAVPLRQVTEIVEPYLVRQQLVLRLAEGRAIALKGSMFARHLEDENKRKAGVA